MVTSLSAYGDHLVVSDQFSSVSLLKLDESQKLVTVARDYSPLWPISVEAVDDKSFIGADVSRVGCFPSIIDHRLYFMHSQQSLNLFTFSVSQSTNNRAILVRDGFYHVGDLITKFIRGKIYSLYILVIFLVQLTCCSSGSLATTTESATGRFKSTHIFCTLSGQIGVVISVENDVLSRFLSALELQLGQKSISAGGISHAKYVVLFSSDCHVNI